MSPEDRRGAWKVLESAVGWVLLAGGSVARSSQASPGRWGAASAARAAVDRRTASVSRNGRRRQPAAPARGASACGRAARTPARWRSFAATGQRSAAGPSPCAPAEKPLRCHEPGVLCYAERRPGGYGFVRAPTQPTYRRSRPILTAGRAVGTGAARPQIDPLIGTELSQTRLSVEATRRIELPPRAPLLLVVTSGV